MQATAVKTDAYSLGSSERELLRLQRQSDYYATLSDLAMRHAGIDSGMRVIDAGSGPGDVAFLAANIVGPTGAVFGIEQSPAALSTARDRALATGLDRVTFVEGDVTTAQLGATFDALVGRFILMHVADPIAGLRNLVSQLSPGAPVLFMEIDIPAATGRPFVPLLEEMRDLICAAFEAAGVSSAPGWLLRQHFLAAGLPEPELLYFGRVDPAPAMANCRNIAQVLRSLLPVIEAKGLATRDELDLDTLAQRLSTELEAHDALIMNPPMVVAISHAP